MLNEYFDERIKGEVIDTDNPEKMATYVYRLAAFSVDLEDRVFNRLLYEASHAKSLKRGNDVKSAIIKKIYDLYNPCYMLSIYETKRQKVEEVIKSHGRDFSLAVENNLKKLNEQSKQEFSLLSVHQIRNNLIERKKKFLVEHYIDVKSQDILDDYDTRDYDLSVLCQDLDLNDITNVYNLTKYNIKNNDLEENLNDDASLNNRKDRLLQEVLGFYAEQVLKIVYKDKIDDEELYWSLVKDMAKKYLGDEYKGDMLLWKTVKKSSENTNEYCMKKEEFLGQGQFGKLLRFIETPKKRG